LDVNNPSQIIEKINFPEKSDSILVNLACKKTDENNTCAVTFVDFYGNESEATTVNFTSQNKTN
jgi:hypothetical protein